MSTPEQGQGGKWSKGMPSPNPAGRGKAFSLAVIEKAKQAAGADGVVAYGGYVRTNEGSSQLTGSQKWTQFANAYSFPPVAIALMLRSALLSGTKWSLTENPAGGKDAARGVEIVEQGLLSAPLPKRWPSIVKKAAMHWANGFSLHAAALGRRPDGMVVYTDIGHRPPHTVEKWHRKNPQARWDSIEQRTADGKLYPIPLDECLYLVSDTLGDSPDGVGVLRLVIERLRRVANYEALEGSEMFGSMGGTPIARVPIEEINASVPIGATAEQALAHRRSRTSAIETIVADRVKTPETRQYAVLDSKTYQGSDPNTISSIPKWDIEIIKGDLQGLPEIRKVISDLSLDVARMLGVEFVYVGGGDTAGTYGMHESKVSMFAAQLQTTLAEIADCAEQQLVRRLIKANGLDPDTAAPTLVPAPIGTADVEKAARTLGLLQMAGLPPGHPAREAIFERLDLPWIEEDALADLMAPRMPHAPVDEEIVETEDPEPEDVEEEAP